MIQVDVVWMAETKPDWGSSLIMWWQGTPYSHVALVVGSEVCHAIDRGVCIEKLETYLQDHRIVFKKTIDLKCSIEELMAFCDGEAGKEYSDMQLVGIALLADPSTRIGRWLRNRSWFLNGDSKRICSEFVAKILSKWSPRYVVTGELDYITPRDLLYALKPESV